MDLEVFLTEEEGKNMCRRSASLPWLFPLQQEKLPDFVSRVRYFIFVLFLFCFC